MHMSASYAQEQNMNRKIIAAGHICIDITPVFPKSAGTFSQISDLLRPGRLIQTEAPDVHTGGSVANTGLALKILGADVKLLGKVGKDEFGGMIRSILDEYGAGGNLIESPDEVTSYSVVVAVPGVDRIFLHCPGANDTFVTEDIPTEELQDAALFHFGYPTIMRNMYENGGSELIRLFKTVKAHGCSSSLDLSAVDPSSPAGRADWRKILSGVLPYVDFFVPSFEELCFMLSPERLRELEKRAGQEDVTKFLDPERDVRPLAEECISMGAKAVLIKCGAPGMFLLVSDKMAEAGERLSIIPGEWNGFTAFEKSYKIERVLSGTGAGDTSIAAFLASILSGCGPRESLENAAATGALCCTSYDAVSALKPLDEIRADIDSGWEKA